MLYAPLPQASSKSIEKTSTSEPISANSMNETPAYSLHRSVKA
ncbi:hypothetical protein APY03_2834 [Variovorax sp. WDL1]|nr:hypothetical protein APY03_2834 [Variovorax sp. WDL1]